MPESPAAGAPFGLLRRRRPDMAAGGIGDALRRRTSVPPPAPFTLWSNRLIEVAAHARPPDVITPEQIHRWDLCVAIAPKLLGEESTWAQLRSCGPHLYRDETLPSE